MSHLSTLSIVIPTHNRRALLMKSLDALAGQSWPVSRFEVLVVADSCEDDTEKMVTAYSAQIPYQLRLLRCCARSAAAARNLGAAHAQGNILLFLDDDVVAQPKLVQAHMATQHQAVGVVLGYSKPILPAKPSLWQYGARLWWEDSFKTMRQPGYRFSYWDFFSGNVSLPTALFHRVGGFATSFKRLEDYELGLKLFKAGARFCYVPDAIGYHYDNTDLGTWLRRIRHEGEAYIQIGQRYPELRTSLFGHSAETCNRRQLLIRKLAFAYPKRGNRLEQFLLKQAFICERLGLRDLRQKFVGALREYNFWRGVAISIGGWQELSAWLQEAPMPPTISPNAPVIDMASLPADDTLQEMLKQADNLGVRLALAGIEVLTIPPQPGAEPLRKEHLQRALKDLAEQQFVPALASQFIRSTAKEGLLC